MENKKIYVEIEKNMVEIEINHTFVVNNNYKKIFMKTKQNAKRKMHQAVLTVMNDSKEIWGVVPQLVNVMEIFSENVKVVNELKSEHGKDIKALLDNKLNKRKELIEISLPVLNVLLAFGHDLKDKDLLKKLNFSRNKLTKSKDLDLIENCKLIYKTAHKFYLKSLETKETNAENSIDIFSYGLNDKMLEDIEIAEKAFIEALTGLKAAVKQKAMVSQQINMKIKENDKLLQNKIDLLMSIFEPSNPDLYKSYNESRKIQKESVQKEEVVKKGKKKKE
jgi:hypothetical protein